MPYQIHSQYLDIESQFHVIELRDGKKRHLVQIAVGSDSCPACGHLTPKDNLGQIDPKAMVAQINESLDAVRDNMHAYAEKHGIPIK